MNFDNWYSITPHLGALPPSLAASRAIAAWARINDKPTSIAFRTQTGTDLSAQVVRIEYDNTVSESMDSSGRAPVRALTIFGIQDHPTEDDTVIAEGYRVIVDNDEYVVRDVIYTIGEVQARAEAIG